MYSCVIPFIHISLNEVLCSDLPIKSPITNISVEAVYSTEFSLK